MLTKDSNVNLLVAQHLKFSKHGVEKQFRIRHKVLKDKSLIKIILCTSADQSPTKPCGVHLDSFSRTKLQCYNASIYEEKLLKKKYSKFFFRFPFIFVSANSIRESKQQISLCK